MIWVGLDLHQRYITACALDEGGAVVAEQRRLAADAEVLIAWLRERGGRGAHGGTGASESGRSRAVG